MRGRIPTAAAVLLLLGCTPPARLAPRSSTPTEPVSPPPRLRLVRDDEGDPEPTDDPPRCA